MEQLELHVTFQLEDFAFKKYEYFYFSYFNFILLIILSQK